MREAIILDVKGIKCDNESCDYVDMDVDFEPDKFLDMPCPKCGCNLFTQKDYDLMIHQRALADAINSLFGGAVFTNDTPSITAEVRMDGSGVAKLGEIKVNTPTDDKFKNTAGE